MPDLTLESFWHCETAERFAVEIASSKPGQPPYKVEFGPSPLGEYQYDWSCTCLGFRIRKKCRHIKEAQKGFCGWQQFMDGDVPVNNSAGEPCCPACGGPVSSTLHGV